MNFTRCNLALAALKAVGPDGLAKELEEIQKDLNKSANIELAKKVTQKLKEEGLDV